MKPPCRRNPPKDAERLLASMIDREIRGRVMWDLEEMYLHRLEDKGRLRAVLWYWMQMFRTGFPMLRDAIYWRSAMLRNYVRVALRNLRKQRIYSLINVLGLAVGLACCLLIFLFVRHELSYDVHHEKADRIHRLTISGAFGDTEFAIAAAAAPTAAALMQDYPEVEEATRLYTYTRKLDRDLRYGDKAFTEKRVVFADANVFDVFTIPFTTGDPKTALSQPNTVVISTEVVEKYFGDAEPIGKTLTMDGETDYTVTGMYEPMPNNGHFHFDFMAALSTLEDGRDTYWLNNMSFRTYVLLAEGASAEGLVAKFPDMVRTYIGGMFERSRGQSFEEVLASGMRFAYDLQPLRSIHLHSDLMEEFEPNGDIRYVVIFSAIAVFILILACINFVNLSTARAMKRAREVGIRKVVGSQRKQLVGQFLIESVVLSIASMLLAVVLAGSVLPPFNQLSGTAFSWLSLTDASVLLSMLVLILVTGILAGLYPAFSLSSFRPIAVLKQEAIRGSRGSALRYALVVFQFSASIILIIGTMVVGKQLRYIQNKDVGFDQEQVVIVQDAYVLGDRIQAFKQEVLRIPDVLSGTVSGFLPVPSDRLMDVNLPEGMYREKGTPMERWQVDYDYVRTMGMEVVEGRDFSREFATDEDAILVNEAAVKHFGWEHPIGMHVGDYTAPPERKLIDWPVIGVVRDFHYESMRNRVGPLLLQIGESANLVSFRFRTENLAVLLDQIRAVWKSFAPAYPFTVAFMDERFQAVFEAEQRIGRIFGMFAGLAVFIGALGLFGLAAFTAEQKTKEIGVRKVLGSSVSGIVILLSKDFIRWVVVANVIAWPAAYFLLSRWLQGFAYRTTLTVTTFLAAGLSAVIIALITVSFQAIKAAVADPVDSLRYE